MLQPEVQRVRHDWETELNCVVLCRYRILFSLNESFVATLSLTNLLVPFFFFLRAFAHLVSLCHFVYYYGITPKDSCDMLY